MRLAGASQPMVAASRARLSGAAAVARQATLPPQTAEVSLAALVWCIRPHRCENQQRAPFQPCDLGSLCTCLHPIWTALSCKLLLLSLLLQRRLLVGAHRSVPIPVTIKGCR